MPLVTHPSLSEATEAERLAFSKHVFRGLILNTAAGAATVSDEWNKIFPDYKFVKVEEFLTEIFSKE